MLNENAKLLIVNNYKKEREITVTKKLISVNANQYKE